MWIAIQTFLVAIATPLVGRVMLALGMGFVTYQGLDALVSAAQSAVIGAYGSMTGPIIQFLGLTGVGQAIGIILSAITTRVALLSIKQFKIT